jgi:serine/threonine-protein phosphatase PP1 catalytic subunit
LLGNHELSHIKNINIYKGGLNQKEFFEKLIKNKYGSMEPLKEYIKFFESLAIFAKTDNKVFISHAGPSPKIDSEKKVNKMLNFIDYDTLGIDDFLWLRYYSITTEKIDSFLKFVNCNVMIVGHTPVNGFKIHGDLMVLSSSFASKNKAYLDIDLKKDINSINELKKRIKYL